MKYAVVTGVTGQDGSYLTDMLLNKGYIVYGLIRPSQTRGTLQMVNAGRIPQHKNFRPVFGDLLDPMTIQQLCELVPDEFYHLAALSHVGESFKHPDLTMKVNTLATVQLLQGLPDKTRFYFAGTSETLADWCEKHYQEAADEASPWSAHSPYAVSKLAAQSAVVVYREAFGRFAVNGLSFNHESPRRGANFVTARIVDGVKRFKNGGQPITLGKNTRRDWHDARDTVRGMWMALQADKARDYVFASGTARSIEEFAKRTCALVGVDYYDAVIWTPDTQEKRPWDVDFLRGNPTRAKEKLGWVPEISLDRMIQDMIDQRESFYV